MRSCSEGRVCVKEEAEQDMDTVDQSCSTVRLFVKWRRDQPGCSLRRSPAGSGVEALTCSWRWSK